MKTKTTLLILLFSFLSFGQEQNSGEIIISRDNLISLLKKFKVDYNYDSINNAEAKIVSSTNASNLISIEKNPNDSILQKINQLEKQLALTNLKLEAIPKYEYQKDSIVYRENPVVNRVDTIYRFQKNDTIVQQVTNYHNAIPQLSSTNYDQQLADLNLKYEEILQNQKAILATQTGIDNVVATVNPIENKVAKKSIADKTTTINPVVANTIPKKGITTTNPTIDKTTLIPIVTNTIPKKEIVTIRDTVYITKPVVESKTLTTTSPNRDALVSKYGSLKKQLFFENNESKLNTNDMNTVSELISILNQNKTVDVFLEGFSSKKGNPIYNETLSLKRTESVKQFLINNGINPKRISSQYHGVDHSASNEAFARRVDVTFEVRK